MKRRNPHYLLEASHKNLFAEDKVLKRLIVGVDPGIKIGMAVFDLRGNLLKLLVLRGGRDHVVEVIREFGRPIIIATDVNPTPSLVRRLAAAFGSEVWRPNRVLLEREKERLARGIKDPHKRDAYAAGLKAYRKYANRFRSIEALGLDIILEEQLKEAVVRGEVVKNVMRRFESR